MKKNITYLVLVFLVQANFIYAQFIVKDITFACNSVSNGGAVSGYSFQTGPYSIWFPDSNNIVTEIGGVAPGSGVAGQARFSEDGNILCGTNLGNAGAEMALFDRTTNNWTNLGSLGYQVDGNVSGGFAISGDGKTVVGLSWADTTGNLAFAHAIAWNTDEEIMDLGTLFFGRSTRANAINGDGSIVVGWQDFNGPWKSAVWKKNPAGGYFPNEYILLNTDGDPNDEFNQMGECSAISADGNWIGGYGDYANEYQPWIWSEGSGVINLGTLPNVGSGYVSGMSADGSIAVGWFDGQLWGDPQTPFIWTKTGGIRDLNEYINTELGESTDINHTYTAEAISPDGHFVAGYGVNNNTFQYFAYRISLENTSAVKEISKSNEITVYPNPTSNLITIENSNNSTLSITSAEGKIIFRGKINGRFVFDLSKYASGVYALRLQTDEKVQTQKIIKN